VVSIPPESFNHGQTRNIGVQHATGCYVILTVQDAIPSSSNWLQSLLDGFTDDQVAGVCGQQVVPHALDKNPIEWFRPVSKPNMRYVSVESAQRFDALTPQQKKDACSWDNVNAAYRRDLLLQYPFPVTNFGEDAKWAYNTVRNGYALVYTSFAQVHHYHEENYDYTFKRTIATLYNRFHTFGLVPVLPSAAATTKALMSNIKVLVKEKKVGWAAKWYWVKYNITKRKAAADAQKVFLQAIQQNNVEQVYRQYCEKAPMATKLTNNKK
jgi:rhamnosyltransferase